MQYKSIRRNYEVESKWTHEILRQTDKDGDTIDIRITRFHNGEFKIRLEQSITEEMFNAIKEASHLDFKDYTFKNVWQHPYECPFHYEVNHTGSLY